MQADLVKGSTKGCIFQIDKITWLFGYLLEYMCSLRHFCLKVKNTKWCLCKCINLSSTVWFIKPVFCFRNGDCMHKWIQRADIKPAGAHFRHLQIIENLFFHVIMLKYVKIKRMSFEVMTRECGIVGLLDIHCTFAPQMPSALRVCDSYKPWDHIYFLFQIYLLFWTVRDILDSRLCICLIFSLPFSGSVWDCYHLVQAKTKLRLSMLISLFI